MSSAIVPHEDINLLHSDITDKTKCFDCNGDGHAATQFMPNGSKLVCPTKVLREIKSGKDTKDYVVLNSSNKSFRSDKRVVGVVGLVMLCTSTNRYILPLAGTGTVWSRRRLGPVAWLVFVSRELWLHRAWSRVPRPPPGKQATVVIGTR